MQPGNTIKPNTSNDDSEDLVDFKIPRDNDPVIAETNPQPQSSDLSRASPPSEPSKSPASPPPAGTQAATSFAESADKESSPWQYSQDSSTDSSQSLGSIEPLVWTASEFVHNEKNMNWFIGLAGATVAVVAITYLLTRELLTMIAILSAASLFGVTAKRKPKTVECRVDQNGVSMDGRFYPYNNFRSFSVMQEGHFNSILLIPLKRLSLPLTLYYLPEMADQLVGTLGSYLPLETRNHDPVEKLMQKVRF